MADLLTEPLTVFCRRRPEDHAWHPPQPPDHRGRRGFDRDFMTAIGALNARFPYGAIIDYDSLLREPQRRPRGRQKEVDHE